MAVYKPKKGIFIKLVIGGFAALAIGFMVKIIDKETEYYSFLFTDLLLLGLFLWAYFDTLYTIEHKMIHYKSAFLSGVVHIDHITEINKNSASWVGIKPATDLNGLIITFNGGEELYISPLDQDAFVNELLSINRRIEIV
jgi:hypothetical protein